MGAEFYVGAKIISAKAQLFLLHLPRTGVNSQQAAQSYMCKRKQNHCFTCKLDLQTKFRIALEQRQRKSKPQVSLYTAEGGVQCIDSTYFCFFPLENEGCVLYEEVYRCGFSWDFAHQNCKCTAFSGHQMCFSLPVPLTKSHYVNKSPHCRHSK